MTNNETQNTFKIGKFLLRFSLLQKFITPPVQYPHTDRVMSRTCFLMHHRPVCRSIGSTVTITRLSEPITDQHLQEILKIS